MEAVTTWEATFNIREKLTFFEDSASFYWELIKDIASIASIPYMNLLRKSIKQFFEIKSHQKFIQYSFCVLNI